MPKPVKKKKRVVSAATRRRMSEGQKKRHNGHGKRKKPKMPDPWYEEKPLEDYVGLVMVLRKLIRKEIKEFFSEQAA